MREIHILAPLKTDKPKRIGKPKRPSRHVKKVDDEGNPIPRGRKKRTLEPCVTRHIIMTDTEWNICRLIGRGNASDGVRIAIHSFKVRRLERFVDQE